MGYENQGFIIIAIMLQYKQFLYKRYFKHLEYVNHI